MPSESIPAHNKRDTPFPWRVFWLLFAASVVGAAAIIPLALELFRPLVQKAPPAALPLPLIIVIGAVQNLALLGLAVGFGLAIARKIGLGAPLLEAWLYHRPSDRKFTDTIKAGVIAGVGVGIIVLIPILIAAPHLPTLPFVTASHASVWKRFLAGFYGGIDEEIISRLFLLSLVAWLGMKLFQRQKARLSSATFWTANIIVAILFGLGHLPSASLVMKITPTVVVLALTLNGIAAIVFGYLYRKRGLEAAMIAHFCADVTLYVIGVAFLRFLPLH